MTEKKDQPKKKKAAGKGRPKKAQKKESARPPMRRFAFSGVMNEKFITNKLTGGVRADSDYIDVDPVPTVIEQQLGMKDVANFVVNASSLFTSGELSAAALDKEFTGKVLSYNWIAPNRYNDAGSGAGRLAATVMDPRGVLVSLDSCEFTFSNQLSCPVKIRYNTPKARQPFPGNVAYRTAEREVEIRSNGTAKVHIRWANSNNDTPHVILRDLRSAVSENFGDSMSLLNMYGVISDIDQYTGAAFVAGADALRVNVSVHYKVHTPTAAYAGESSDTITVAGDSPKFQVEDLGSLQNCYQLDPPLQTPESGGDLMIPKPVNYVGGNGKPVNVSDVINVAAVDLFGDSMSAPEFRYYALVRANREDPTDLYPVDFKNSPDNSVVKYPGTVLAGGKAVCTLFKRVTFDKDMVVVPFDGTASDTKKKYRTIWCGMYRYGYGSAMATATAAADDGGGTGMDYALSGVKRNVLVSAYRQQPRSLGILLAVIAAVSQVVQILDSTLANIRKK